MIPALLPKTKNSYPEEKNGLIQYFSNIWELKQTMPTDAKNARWVCLECHWIYDPAKGDPKNGIPAGTPWDQVPDTWRCPECKIFKAKKGVFKRRDD
jgi:rubredoxin